MQNSRQLILFLLLISVMILVSCGEKQPTQHQPPASQMEESSSPEATETETGQEDQIDQQQDEAYEDTITVEEFLQQVMEEAAILRTDGARLSEENNLEEARQAYDAALNVILSSGLALDAHPRLAEMFKDITREVVRVEDQITGMENGVDESLLVDELEDIEIDSEELDEIEAESEAEVEKENPVTYDIPVVHNLKVDYFIQKFTTTRREAIAEGIKRSGQFIDRFREILKEEGVPQDLVYLAMIESTFKVRAFSRAKAKGIWQFMSWTGKRYGLRIDWWVDERSDPFKACRAAARYLKELYEDLGSWHLAMAAYNGGPGRVGRAVKALGTKDFWKISSTSRYLRRETRNFVPSILAAAIIMKNRETYGFDEIEEDQPWSYDTVRIDSPIDLRVLAELGGIPTDAIQELNPALRRLITPQDYDNYSLRVPLGTGEKLALKLANLPKEKRLKYTEHLIRRGDTLSRIAQRYGSSVKTIMTANNISNPRRLRPGQVIVVPLSPGYAPEWDGGSSSSYSKGQKLTHTVRRGDSLYKIARRYGTTVGSLAKWNGLNPYNPIHPGRKLTVYARTQAKGTSSGATAETSGKKTLYTVKQGDTLYDIAMRYNISVSSLKRWNNLSRNLIKPGDKLTLYLNSNSE